MKIEDSLFFAMSDDSVVDNEYVSSKCGSHESADEGCCILLETLTQPLRRVKSTPNLLQIPSRSRKKSDDSAVGSEEEVTDKSDPSLSGAPDMLYTHNSKRSSSSPSQSPRSSIGTIIIPTLRNHPDGVPTTSATLKPDRIPSVIVSDHDLCPTGETHTFITLDDLEAEFQSQSLRRRLSDCSTCSTLSLNDIEYVTTTNLPEDESEDEGGKKTSPWRRIRTIVHQLTPFIQTYKKQRYPWVQLAGHQGNFKAGDTPGTILKKFCAREKDAFELLMNDPLQTFVPKYYGSDSTEDYLQLEDLLGRFDNPCVMDCKIGVRTYLEEELLKAKEKPKLRKDMYEKMCQIDPAAATTEEKAVGAVTKPRYMVWRETISTTATLGFRIEGVRKSDGSSSKDFKTTRHESEVKEAFRSFVTGYEPVIKQYLERLHELRDALEHSKFFNSHEVIGSSLLFVHDVHQASVWMIDFAKTIPLPSGTAPLKHSVPWKVGNHEDGYLIGLVNLIKIFEELRTV